MTAIWPIIGAGALFVVLVGVVRMAAGLLEKHAEKKFREIAF